MTTQGPAIHISEVKDGDPTPFVIGIATQGGPRPSRTITVRNLGKSKLTIDSVSLPPGFILSKSPSKAVDGGKHTHLVIDADTATPGYRQGKVTIMNNSANAAARRFTFTIASRILAPNPPPFTPGLPVSVPQNSQPPTPQPPTPQPPTPQPPTPQPPTPQPPTPQPPTPQPPTPQPQPQLPAMSVFVNGMPYQSGSSDVFRTSRFTSGTIDGRGGPDVAIGIANNGLGDLVISGWSLGQGFESDSPAPSRIARGSFFSLRIFASYPPLGFRSGRLIFNHNDPTKTSFTLSLRGMIFEGRYTVAGEPNTIPFGGVAEVFVSNPALTVSVEPANGAVPFNGRFVVSQYDFLGRTQSRMVLGPDLRTVIVRGANMVDDWTNGQVTVRSS